MQLCRKLSLPFNSKAFIILFTDNSLFPITAISRLALALSVHSLSCTCPVLVPHSYSSCLLFIHLQDWAAPSIHPLHGYVDNGYASPIFSQQLVSEETFQIHRGVINSFYGVLAICTNQGIAEIP